MLPRRLLVLLIAAMAIFALPSTMRSSRGDVMTFIRKKSTAPPTEPPTMQGLAKLLTHLEDELRKYGSITVKSPDVWGESTLMSMVQEYERYMRVDAANFQAGMQGYVARSDQATLQAQLSMGIAAANATAANNTTVVAPPDATLVDPPGTPFNMLPSGGVTLSLEPTEMTREHSVFMKVNQALRRTNLGDDNSRQPGYTSYVVRFPVSVLPGRHTYKGCAAVVNIRARLALDDSHLRDTFPRLAVSDLVAAMVPCIDESWESIKRSADLEETLKSGKHRIMSSLAPRSRDTRPSLQAVDDRTIRAVYGTENVAALYEIVKEHFAAKPKSAELEGFVFSLLMQVESNLERQEVFAQAAPQIVAVGRAMRAGAWTK